MGDTSDHILLTEGRAAVILQPHMRNKSAAHWLENDRRYDPVIPFHYLQGQPYYLESDLVNFITKALNPAARFVRVRSQLLTDIRQVSERRRHSDRRISEGIVLSHLIERRDTDHFDRRLSGVLNRRTEPAI